MPDFLAGEAPIAWFDGEYMPVDEVRISPFDRGFLFADGVYEGIRWYPRSSRGGGVFRMRQHLQRLAASLATLKIEGVDLGEIEMVLPELIARNGLAEKDAVLYLQVTRGVAPRTHAFPDPPVPPTRMALARAFAPFVEQRRTGVSATLVEDLRWGRCDIKSISLLPNVLAKEEAIRAGSFEALFVREGMLLEGSHTAVMAVRDGVLIAPPEGPEILPSVTRELVLALARELVIEVELRPIPRAELPKVTELMVLGTSAEVMPVVCVDGVLVGDGRPGPVTRRLQEAWPAGR
jgi:D-alanine transaminase